MGRYRIDLTGQRFGRLTVIERAPDRKGNTYWRCKCDCGNEMIVYVGSLRGGHTTSCGCKKNETEDLTGKRFGKLTVLKQAPSKNGARWICKCDCGNEIITYAGNLRSGCTTSCGCAHRETLTKHGDSKGRLYRVWSGMKKRCYNKNCQAYKYYGALGVTVCDGWKNDYAAFRDWALSNGYDETTGKLSQECTLDRINPFKGYSPDNCRWADAKTQANNRRKNWSERKGE